MIGLTFDKVLVIALIASLLIGPAHLPAYAAKLAKLVKSLRGFAGQAQARLKAEMGDDFEDVDWKKLDPRQYDPRRIVREALQEPVPSRTEPSDAAASSKDGTGP
jgi:sec-independent protein translocase protein TatB